MAETKKKKVKVAIIGGGCGALTAAYRLSDPQYKDQYPHEYEITVYQMGWRLGGKGASGRNEQAHNRTEEHGLHVWMGFYENAFGLIRDCYRELDELYTAPGTSLGKANVQKPIRHNERQSLFGSWDDAFFAEPCVGVADDSRGKWRTWASFFPPTPGLPGDPLDAETNPFSLAQYLARTCDLLRALIRSSYVGGTEKPPTVEEFSSVSPRTIVDKITSAVKTGVLTGAGALYEAASVLKVVLSETLSLPGSDYLVVQYAEAIASNLMREAEALFARDDHLGPKLELVELVVTVIVGVLRDGLLSDPDGLDAINDEDCKVWLTRHGASARATESPLVRALYNMAFADQPLDPQDEPGLAAGQALRGALRMFFTYRGSLFWKMRASMADTVFSPLYEVLKHRGVKFEFFHELVNVVPKDDEDDNEQPYIEELHFHIQARPRARDPKWRTQQLKGALSVLEARAIEDGEYYPLDADGCWPAAPDFQRLDPKGLSKPPTFESPTEKPTPHPLKAGKDFDVVVLGVSIGALENACGALLAKDSRWRAMVDGVKTTSTQALQLWLRKGVETLCDSPTPITVSGFLKPFDTWSDMTHIVAQERWPDTDKPEGLVYLCGALPYADDDGKVRQQNADEALEEAVHYLDNILPRLWPAIGHEKRGGFRWDLLVGGPTKPRATLSQQGKLELLKSQYFAINTNPSDRYVLSRPGTMQYRISPLDTGYQNMTIAGDWTDCGFNEGCVEAAVMSGLLASHVVCQSPLLEEIIGFDHP
jgi:uncharacterized protein with NAD-binding domain and iron-sulfur cluster